MLELGIVAGAAYAFFQLAKNNGLTPWIWSVLAFVGYFGGAFAAVLLIGLFAPDMIYDQVMLTILGLVAGGLGILVVYLILKLQIKKKDGQSSSADLLDNDTL